MGEHRVNRWREEQRQRREARAEARSTKKPMQKPYKLRESRIQDADEHGNLRPRERKGSPKSRAEYEGTKWTKAHQDAMGKLQAVATERATAAGWDKHLERSAKWRREQSEAQQQSREMRDTKTTGGSEKQPYQRKEITTTETGAEKEPERSPFPEIAGHRKKPLSEMQMRGNKYPGKIGRKITPHTEVHHPGRVTEPVMDEHGKLIHPGGTTIKPHTEYKKDKLIKNPRWGKDEKEYTETSAIPEHGKTKRKPESEKVVERPTKHALGPDKYQTGEDEEISRTEEKEYIGTSKLSGKKRKKKPKGSESLGEMKDVPVTHGSLNLPTGETKREFAPKFPMGDPRWNKEEKPKETLPKKGKPRGKKGKKDKPKEERKPGEEFTGSKFGGKRRGPLKRARTDLQGKPIKRKRQKKVYTDAEITAEYENMKRLGMMKAEEGAGGMLMGANRGLGHEAGYTQGSGESTQVTEVKEEKEKSAYENHEQDESPDSQPNKQQIPPSKVGMDAIKTRLKLLKNKYTNIYKPLNL